MKNLKLIIAMFMIAMVVTPTFAQEKNKKAKNSNNSIVEQTAFVLDPSSSMNPSRISINRMSILSALEQELNQLAAEKHLSAPDVKSQMTNIKADSKIEINKVPQYTNELKGSALYDQASKSTLIFGMGYKCKTCDKVHSSSCSAFVISEDGICVTNHHVFEGFVKADGSIDMLVYSFDGKAYPVIEVLQFSEKDDVAIFRVDTKGSKLVPFPLGNPAPTGSDVNILSNPDNNYFFFTKGVVSNNYIDPRSGIKSMTTTADYAKGSSGAPLFDNAGNVIGMVSSTSNIYYYNNPNREPQMVIKTCVPVESILKLITIK